MAKPFFVTFDTPREVSDGAYEALRQANQSGKIRKGTNETTKALERGIAKLVLIAEDTDPPEIVAHLPLLCDDRKVPYIFVPSKERMGPALGIDIGAAAACVTDPGDAGALIEQVVSALEKSKAGGA